MAMNTHLEKYLQPSKLLGRLNLAPNVFAVLQTAIKSKGFSRGEVETQITVPEVKTQRRRMVSVRLRREDKSAFLKYISTSHKRRIPPERVIPKKTVSATIKALIVDLDVLQDAEQQVTLYDLFLEKSDPVTEVEVRNSHLYRFVKIIGADIKKSSVRVFTDSRLSGYFILSEALAKVPKVVDTSIDLEEIDDDRLQLAINAQIQKAVSDVNHPLHAKINKLLDSMDVTDDTAAKLLAKNSKVVGKQQGPDEVL
jgi:hypothetical protein